MDQPQNKVLVGSARNLSLARSYVEGLERQGKRLAQVEADHMQLNWEAITLAYHVLVQQRLLRELVAHFDKSGWPNTKLESVSHEVVDGSRALIQRIFECPCGHATFDHDERGCVYLGCKPICGVA